MTQILTRAGLLVSGKSVALAVDLGDASKLSWQKPKCPNQNAAPLISEGVDDAKYFDAAVIQQPPVLPSNNSAEVGEILIQIDMGEGKPCVGLVMDGHGVVLMAPPVVGYMLEWEKARVLAYAEYRGWKVTEIEDEC